MSDALSATRSFVLVGGNGSGKTSVAEMLLFSTKAIPKLGSVSQGTATLDFEPEEAKRGGSIQTAFASYPFGAGRHFLVDVPGDPNFHADLPYLLSAVDAAIFVVDAVDGIKPVARRMYSEVAATGMPVLFVINKLNKERADFNAAVSGIQDMLGIKPFVLHLPMGEGPEFRGIINVLDEKASFLDPANTSSAIPDDMAEVVANRREPMVEEIAVCDDGLMERYFAEGGLPLDELKGAMRRAVVCSELYPVLCCAADKGFGAAELVAAIADYLPTPLDSKIGIKELESVGGDFMTVDPAGPFVGFVAKTSFDPFAGQLSYVAVKSGTLTPDATLLDTCTGEKVRVGGMFYSVGKELVPAKQPQGPGAIIALAKLGPVATGDTLCAPSSPFELKKAALPAPMAHYALAPETKGEEEKVFTSLHKFMEEDVTLHLTRGEETGEMILAGVSQAHLEMVVERVKRRFKVGIKLLAPKIPYREALKGKAEAQGRHKKQTGGRGQFGDCHVRIESSERGAGYKYVDAIVGGSIPRNYIPAVDKGVQEAAARGILAGYPVVDFTATVYDGSYHTVDSSEMAFKIAGSLAFKAACEKLKVILLEPVVSLTVHAPEANMGDIIGDISSRRGKVLGSESENGMVEVVAQVPQAELVDYGKQLSALTGGLGAFTASFDHYDECPALVAEKVVAAAKAAKAAKEA